MIVWIKSSVIEKAELERLKHLALQNNQIDLFTLAKIAICKYRVEFKLIMKKYLDGRKKL